jgi:hypothetical protein
LETNPNVNNTICIENEAADLAGSDELILVDLVVDDLILVMSWAISSVEDLVDQEDLVSANEMISSRHSRSPLRKHTWVSRKRSDITDESWLKELQKKPVLPVMGTEKYSNRHRRHLG